MTKKLEILLAAACGLAATVACILFYARGGPLTFQPDSLPAAQVGVPYEANIKIGDNITPAGQFSISEGALPPGLTMETLPRGQDAARIFGTPTQGGTFKFKVFVWCLGTNVSGQTGEKEYSLTVK